MDIDLDQQKALEDAVFDALKDVISISDGLDIDLDDLLYGSSLTFQEIFSIVEKGSLDLSHIFLGNDEVEEALTLLKKIGLKLRILEKDDEQDYSHDIELLTKNVAEIQRLSTLEDIERSDKDQPIYLLELKVENLKKSVDVILEERLKSYEKLNELLSFLGGYGKKNSVKKLFEDTQKLYSEVDSCRSDMRGHKEAVAQHSALAIDHIDEESSSLHSRADSALEEFLARKAELLEQIESIASSAAEKGVVADHQRTAASEKFTADWLRAGAVILMLCVVGFAGYSIINLESVTTEQTVLRLVASLLLTMPAAYLARESAKHRQQQHRYHEIALNVAAVNPLINGLEKADQDRIRAQIASDLLSANTSGNSVPVADPMPINSNDLLLKLVDKWPTSSATQQAQQAQQAQPVQSAPAAVPLQPATPAQALAQEEASAQPAEQATEKPPGEKNATPA